MTKNNKHIYHSFIKQTEITDCGVVCLFNIIKYYKGYVNLEKLRELSGTNKKGTTLLGLFQAAQKSGFTAEGIEADIDYLKTIEKPSILHVIIDNQLQHYIICYGYKNGKFIIGDPSRGIMEYTPQKIKEIWISKSLLSLEPNEKFSRVIVEGNERQKWFWALVAEDIQILIIISILSVVVSFLGLILSIFSQQLIDNILPHADRQKLFWGLILISLLLFIRGGINYFRGHLLILQNRDFNNRIIEKFYKSLLYLPKTFFTNRRTGELVARMEDTSRIQNMLAFVFGDLIKDALLVIISLGVVFYYSNTVGFLMLITLPIFFLIAYIFHSKIAKCQFEVMAANALKSSNYINTLQGVDTIKVHNKELEFSVLNKLIYGVFQDKLFNLGKLGITLQFITDVISVIIIIGILSICSIMVLSKHLLIGELTALISITSSMLPSIGNLAFANIRIKGAEVAFDRMYQFTSIEPEYNYDSNNQEENKGETRKDVISFKNGMHKNLIDNVNFEKLKVQNISFHFPGRRNLFKDISLTIEKGKITALIGENGSGKTTFFNILEKFYQPEDGTIFFNAIPFEEISIPVWRNLIGVMPQEISIYNGILFTNICLTSNQEEFEKVNEFCLQYGFDQYFKTFPQSYSTILGEEGVTLSGGQKQLIALARALYKKPQLLLLDEPTSAMDKNMERFVLDLLKSLLDQMGIFIIAHRSSIVKFADIVYILEEGTICAEGSPIELLKTTNLYSESFKEFRTLT